MAIFMYTTNTYCQKVFGEKLYKLSLNPGFTCPNRDGKIDSRGCIFCSAGGSGDFASPCSLPMDAQIEEAKKRVAAKYKGNRYIAYFQAYTNTYASPEKLREIYLPVASRPDIAVLDIATRPDCLQPEILQVLAEISSIKPVWVELGLQTSKNESAEYIRRGYELPIYERSVKQLNDLGIHTITHIILGLPGESKKDMFASVKYAADCGTKGIKLQLLHVLKGTDLAKDYAQGKFKTLELEEYLEIVEDCLKILPQDIVVHRLTGDGPKSILIAPQWSANKRMVLNRLNQITKPYFQ